METVLFVDAENIRLYEEDFYWLAYYRVHNLKHIYIYLDSSKANSNITFYEEMKKHFFITICDVSGCKKNAVDIQIAIDLIEFAYTHPRETTSIMIASNDADFFLIYKKLKDLEWCVGFIFLNEACRKSSPIMYTNHDVYTILLNELTFEERAIMKCFLWRHTSFMSINYLKKTLKLLRLRKQMHPDIYRDIVYYMKKRSALFHVQLNKHPKIIIRFKIFKNHQDIP